MFSRSVRFPRALAIGGALLLSLLGAAPVLAQNATGGATLPTDSWVYPILDELSLRGAVPELRTGTRPFTRGQIARALRRDSTRLSPSIQPLRALLDREFAPELTDSLPDGTTVLEGATLAGVVRNDEPRARFFARNRIAVQFGRHLTLVNAMRIDNGLPDDSLYAGDVRGNLAGLTEQAYLRYEGGPLEARLGRDYLRFGPGRAGQLVLGEGSRPFDQLGFLLAGRGFAYTQALILLDETQFDLRGTDRIHRPTEDLADPARRYLAAQRIEATVGGWLWLGVNQTALFGGRFNSTEFSPKYVVPFLAFYGEQGNDAVGDANVVLSFDANVFFARRAQIWAELMIDDLQAEKKTQADLEPPLYGFTVGASLADPVAALSGTTLTAELSQVSNRAYNVRNQRFWQKDLHRWQPIGLALGNNLRTATLTASRWLPLRVPARAELGLRVLQRGQPALRVPLDEPWLDSTRYTVSGGYSEAFPFGPHRTSTELTAALWAVPHPDAQLRLTVGYRRVSAPAGTTATVEDYPGGPQFGPGAIVKLDLWLDPEIVLNLWR